MPDIYRKAALDRLSSPEQLDRMIRVTSPASWLALIGAALIIVAALLWSVFGQLPQTSSIAGIIISANRVVPLNPPASGTISKINVTVGQSVSPNQVLLSITDSHGAKKDLKAASFGKVLQFNYQVGDFVQTSDEVARLMVASDSQALNNNDIELICYAPVNIGKNLQPGMAVTVVPTNVNEQVYGHLVGVVDEVPTNIVSPSEMMMRLGNEVLVNTFQQLGPVMEVHVKLQRDPDAKSGYKWSNKNGNNVSITADTMVTAKIVTDSEAPIVKLLPFLRGALPSPS